MKAFPKIYRHGSVAAKRAFRKLEGRLATMENMDSKVYRARVKKVFGKVLSPGQVVSRILEDLRSKGDAALKRYALQIEGVNLTPSFLRVSKKERSEGFKRTPAKVRKALRLAAQRIARYQKRLLPSDIKPFAVAGGPRGVRTGMAWAPLERVGIYVPGGTAAYPSSVLMNVIPAQVAGVKQIAVATPCGPDGRLNDGVLCACELLGVEEVYRMGGAQAIGALAYGTRSIPKVDKIIGPGNIFVMLAKRAVFGEVDIDMLAGPSEVLVVADGKARPDWIAADLLAQAEHDPLACCVLVTTSERVAAKTQIELMRQLQDLPRRSIAEASLKDWGLILVTKNMGEAIEVANGLAPEHLELLVDKPNKWAPKLTRAGAIFLGPYATEPLGDYMAGPSHTLPTGGTARAFSGVSVYTFLRRTGLIGSDPKGLEELSEAIQALAEVEGLEAHRRAVAIRGGKRKG